MMDWNDRIEAAPASLCRLCGTRMPDEACPPDVVPAPGSVVTIWKQPLRLLGIATDRLVLATVSLPFALFLVPDADGTPGLMRIVRFAELLRTGEAEVQASPDEARLEKAAATVIAAERLRTECQMLDAAGIAMGIKAIDIFIHAHWTEELRCRFGEPDNPHTIKRWRARRGREGPT